jgi:hypothetical protein
MYVHLRDAALLLASCLISTASWATGPMSSANYAIPSSTLNAGVGPMASANYKLNSSLGDPFFGGSMASAGYDAAGGFWPTIFGVGPACILDLDGNGSIDPMTDGLLIIRAMSGLTDAAVTSGVLGPGASRTTWAQMQPFFHANVLDIDGDGTTEPFTDGLLILRAMFGMTGNSVTTNAVAQNATRADWNGIRSYLNATCGTAFQ